MGHSVGFPHCTPRQTRGVSGPVINLEVDPWCWEDGIQLPMATSGHESLFLRNTVCLDVVAVKTTKHEFTIFFLIPFSSLFPFYSGHFFPFLPFCSLLCFLYILQCFTFLLILPSFQLKFFLLFLFLNLSDHMYNLLVVLLYVSLRLFPIKELMC